MKYTRK